MNPLKSIVARYQGYILTNIQKSKYGKKLRKIKNAHKGERCFIVANGPSLTSNDLEKIYQNNEYSFGMNRIYKMFDETNWRPSFYVCEDINIFNESIDEINSIPSQMKFIPLNLHFYNNINIDDAYYFKANYDRNKDYPHSFSTEIDVQMDSRGTVTFTCINIAAYMGFKDIYLVGVDHNYHITVNEAGETIVDDNAKDYFCDDYDNDIKDIVSHDMGQNTRAYRDAKVACDSLGINVFNATRGGKLEVFVRKNLDEVFKEIEDSKK